MNFSENQLDFQTLIKLEENFSLNNSFVFNHNSNNNNNNNINKDLMNELNDNLSQFYDSLVMNSNPLFVCKYKDCDQTEATEEDIVDHLRHHFNGEPKVKVEMDSKSDIDFNENQLIIDNNDFEDNVLTKDKSSNKSNEDMTRADSCVDETKYWDKILNSNKNWLQRPHSKTSLPPPPPPMPPIPSLAPLPSLRALTSLPPLSKPPVLTPFAMDSTPNPLNQLMNPFIDDRQLLERMSFMASMQSSMSLSSQNSNKSFDEMNESIEKKDVLLKSHLNISNNEENILLSCKGLASMSKVRQYYESVAIDGQKYFLCRWERCSFRTKKSQKIAQHINLSHIGVEFKCNKPNCNKVFKNPNTYREHQKNHICGFGIFGYGSKGVIGVCRNENLNRYRERVIIDGKKFYRCTWILADGSKCAALTRYHMAMKRHSHSHVCPYRKNLKLKQNQEVIHNMKSDFWNLDLGLGAIASTSGAPLMSPNMSSNSESNANLSPNSQKKIYQCRRTKCRATFINENEKRKHENLLCPFIKNTNNLNNCFINSKTVETKAMFSNKQKSMFCIENEANEQLLRKAVVPLMNGNRVPNSSKTNIEVMANVDKYLSTKLISGVEYHLCVYKGCRFTSKVIHKTIDHIQTQHSLALEPTLNIESNIAINCVQNNPKRNHSFIESPETNGSNDYKKSKNIEIIVNNVSPYQVLDTNPMPTNTSAMTGQSVVKQFNANTDETTYICTQNDCHFSTEVLSQLKVHNMEAHNHLFGCDIEGCGKQFRSESALKQHKQNHICGFNIPGRKAQGVCHLDNIRKYREEIVVGTRVIYSCKWFGCYETFENKGLCLSHIHNRHVCVNRIHVSPTGHSATNSIEANRKMSPNLSLNPNQSFNSSAKAIEMIEI